MLTYAHKLLTIALTMLVVVVAGTFVASLMPIPGNIELKIVKSGSMEPSIPTGALVLIKPASAYGVGNVITFGPDTKTQVPTTHRITAVTAGGEPVYTTKGDANEDADTKTVAHRDVIGKVLLGVPYAGFVLDFARKPLGFALLIGLPALMIMLDELLTIVGEVRKLRRNVHKEKRLRQSLHAKKSSDPLFGGTPRLFSHAGSGSVMQDIRTAVRRAPEPPQHTRQLVMGFIGLVLSGSVIAANIGGTVSYFSDLEHSIGNVFQAGTWGEPNDSLEEFSGNLNCQDFGYPEEEKFEPITAGTTTQTIAGFGDITLEIYPGETVLDWSSTFGIDGVIVKAANGGNFYTYSPESFGDEGLIPPTNPNNNKLFEISHVSFCYDNEIFEPLVINNSHGGPEPAVLGDTTGESASSTASTGEQADPPAEGSVEEGGVTEEPAAPTPDPVPQATPPAPEEPEPAAPAEEPAEAPHESPEPAPAEQETIQEEPQ